MLELNPTPRRLKPRVRLSGKDRRLKIVQAAIDLFSRKGFDGTTTKEIAAASGITEALIFRHFESKQDLYAAIIDFKTSERRRMMRSALDEAARKKDDRGFFARLGYDILESHSNDSSFMRLLLYSGLEGHELSRMVYETHVLEMFTYLADYIAERTREKAFVPVNPRVAARAFIGMIVYHAIVGELFDTQGRLLKITNKQAAFEFAEIFLHGVLQKEKGKPNGK